MAYCCMPEFLLAVEAEPKYSEEMLELLGQLKTSLDAFDLIDSSSTDKTGKLDWTQFVQLVQDVGSGASLDTVIHVFAMANASEVLRPPLAQ